jgi:hypothetical protein
LIQNNYHFVQTATGVGTLSGSARYDRVYSTFSIRQEFERAFDTFEPICDHWTFEENGETRILDPYRYTIAWESDEERIAEVQEHKIAVHRAFTEAKVIIITVGQAEIWYDKRDFSVFPMIPPLEVYDPEIHAYKTSTFQENLENLRRCRTLLFEHNPNAHIIITTSPVPLKITFKGENSIIANNAMKSMLRAVVDEFVRESGDRVSYFPAYEVVTQLGLDSFEEDGRHVQRPIVSEIMSLFESIYTASPKKSSLSRFWKDVTQFRETENWVALSTLCEEVPPEMLSALKPRAQVNYYNTYGEACLFTSREAEAHGHFIHSQAIDEEINGNRPINAWKVTGSQITRLNYLIALYAYEDLEETRVWCHKLAQIPNRPIGMIIVWLDHLKTVDDQVALTEAELLIKEYPDLIEGPEMISWLEGF